MPHSYDLTKLDPNAFEHLVNLLAIQVLGAGHTGFGPGSDGGRDGYFEGEAPYPSQSERWSGTWYIQSKFHAPRVSGDPQKWLLERIKEELDEFKKPDSRRIWPDNWIIATNIDPSGVPMTGAFDAARRLVKKARPELAGRFHIWGGSKILQLLSLHPEIHNYYRHFLTPGHVLTRIYDGLQDARAEVDNVINYLVVRGLTDNQYTKLEQAGASGDSRPGIHRLFIDLPFMDREHQIGGLAVKFLARALARNHRIDGRTPASREWKVWNRFPSRARAWFLKGGPGQGKSTVGQFICQVQRAALVLQEDGPRVLPSDRELAEQVRVAAEDYGIWPMVPRIPVVIELREYAQWFGRRGPDQPKGVLSYLAEKISVAVELPVLTGTLRRALGTQSWLVVFDGLDEVPHDVKDSLAREVREFVDRVALEVDADLFTLCTSRPQGYSGQFSELDAPTIHLTELSPQQALECAEPVLKLDRTASEAAASKDVLQSAIKSSSVRELMKTPLQAHIMAVVVRDGGRPPERRWQLFTNFYHVIRRREANRDLADERLAKLLREEEQLLKTVHSRLGFVLHARAETSEGAITRLERSEFEGLVRQAVTQMMDEDVDEAVDVLMDATTERLVLVNTPDDGNHLRFDVRPLQEFFAAEFLYESAEADELGRRLEVVAGDAHWREVIHFLLSALVESGRRTELAVAIKVLEALDEGQVDYLDRLLARRLARGSLLSARLLEEGVLDQDKRYREQFRNSLQTLCGLTGPTMGVPLGIADHDQSRQWLIRYLFTSLMELACSENVGSSVLLSYLLEDRDEYREGMVEFLLSAPKDYTAYVLSHRVRSLYMGQQPFDNEPRSLPPQRWLIAAVLYLLRRGDWPDAGYEGVHAMMEILRMNPDLTMEVAGTVGLNKSEVALLQEVVNRPAMDRENSVRYGSVSGLHYMHDWTTGLDSLTSREGEEALEDPKVSGLFALIQRILRFATNRSFGNFTEVLKQFHLVGENLLTAIPGHIGAFLPVDPYRSPPKQFSLLRSLNEEQYADLIQNSTLGSWVLLRPTVHLAISAVTEEKDWRTIVERMPAIALELLWSDVQREEISREVRKRLVARVLEAPDILLFAVNGWGELLRFEPALEHEMRRAFLEAAESDPPWGSGWLRRSEPFELALPSEAPLLPHITASLLGGLESYPGFTRDDDLDPKEMRRLVSTYVPDPAALEALLRDETQPSNIRRASLLLLAMHQTTSDPVGVLHENCVGLYTKQEDWYVRALAAFLKQWGDRSNPHVRSIVSRMLDATREDYTNRGHIQLLVALWREESNGPVSERGLISDWLAA